MKRLIFALAICSTVLLSCSKDDDSTESNEFQGNWSGQFTGDDQGTWEVTITNNGNLEGEFISDSFEQFPVPLEGNVNEEGEINATFENNYLSGTFTGNISNDTASGTWSQTDDPDFAGTWEGSRD